MSNDKKKVWPIIAAVIFAMTVFATAGFLIYNFYPARVFMGDTGSLFLGGLVVGATFLLDEPMIIFLIGIIYLLVSGLVKIRVKNVISVIVGLMIFFVDGVIINTLYAICNLEPCNSMYLLEAPFADMPWLITPVMGLMGVAVAFIITATYEQIALPKEERWYSLLREKHSKIKDKETLNSK